MTGQPYERQWWMRYGFIPASYGKGTIGIKQNKFTGTVWIFTRPETGNRWNESGYGYGRWVKARDAINKARSES